MEQPRKICGFGWVKRLRRVSSGLLLALIIMLAQLDVRPALADIAPPDQPPGTNPVPGTEPTQVRMLAEDVLIDVLGNTPAGSLGQARVTAQFSMQNLGQADEKLAVRFPLTFLSGGDNGFGSYPEIKDFTAWVNDRQVSVRRVIAPGFGYTQSSLPWAEFTVIFPAGKTVPVEVKYLVEGVGEYPFIAFKYILETGAGWRDTIGEARLALRLPYEANNQNLIFDEQIGWSQTTAGGVISGREIQWKFMSLEPDALDNLEVSLVMPSVWKQVLQERTNVAGKPGDGEAWGRLGKLYKEIISYRRGLRQDAGGRQLYQLSIAAYETALQLLPDDALWHAGFADLLYRDYYWSQFFLEYPDHTEALRALDEFRLALALAPGNMKIQEMVDEITYSLPEAVQREGDRYIFLWLTATPTPHPTQTATSAPTLEIILPSATPNPTPSPQMQLSEQASPTARSSWINTQAPWKVITETPAGSPTPAPKGSGLHICGANIGLIVALFLFGSLWWNRHWRR